VGRSANFAFPHYRRREILRRSAIFSRMST
jgi:hypothetical protein